MGKKPNLPAKPASPESRYQIGLPTHEDARNRRCKPPDQPRFSVPDHPCPLMGLRLCQCWNGGSNPHRRTSPCLNQLSKARSRLHLRTCPFRAGIPLTKGIRIVQTISHLHPVLGAGIPTHHQTVPRGATILEKACHSHLSPEDHPTDLERNGRDANQHKKSVDTNAHFALTHSQRNMTGTDTRKACT